MAAMYRGVGGETKTSAPVEPTSRSARRRRMEVHQFNIVPSDMAVTLPENGRRKRQRFETVVTPACNCNCSKAVESAAVKKKPVMESGEDLNRSSSLAQNIEREIFQEVPRFGLTSVCGRRRDMEDAVAVHPCFCSSDMKKSSDLHFYGVYDGHGCSHVAMKCKDRMHEIVKNELENCEGQWSESMKRSFSRMDEEITEWSTGAAASDSNCRCELQTPQCDAVGSTAVVAVVTPEKVIVSNCGDSRAILCRKGVAIPLSSDHKPDRPDELARIEEAGGRVIYWDGARVLGVLAMSRAIGDNYLKPFVIPEPDVTVTDRTAEDEFMILASDGLWDVVSNETACNVATMCLRGQNPSSPVRNGGATAAGDYSDKACSDASMLLTKLALARNSSDNVSVLIVNLKGNL